MAVPLKERRGPRLKEERQPLARQRLKDDEYIPPLMILRVIHWGGSWVLRHDLNEGEAEPHVNTRMLEADMCRSMVQARHHSSMERRAS